MYTALYRKKRPTTFGEIVGQDSIITTLCNQLRNEHVSHAYLFCGTRGTGKTSTARVFARALNCSHIKDNSDPCNECETCRDILAERNLNVIEIDAASNNGVDNIRDLREEVKYPPTSGKYKVYIIDEVHMLTTAAFNALLKTLEEPPSHIVFILATTEAQKIPATIHSRCQRYDFKRISREDMVTTLSKFIEAEGIEAEKSALEYIAAVSEGALRDALSILDQCLSLYTDKTISLENVQALLGAVDLSSLFAYGDALLNCDSEAALHIISKVSKEGRDFSRFTADIINHFRNLLIASQLSNPDDILDTSSEIIGQYKSQGSKINPATLITFIQEFSELQNQMRYLPQERIALEVCTIKLCGSKANPQVAASEASFSPVEALAPTNPTPADPPSAPEEHPKTVETKNENNISGDWQNFCSSLSMLLKPILLQCEVEQNNNNIIITSNTSNLQILNSKKAQISSEIKSYFNLAEDPDIVFTANEGYNKDTFKENIQNKISLPVDFQ